MKNFGANCPLYPEPVLMIGTYDEKGNIDVMNAAWGGISDFNQLTLSLSASHKTVKNILAKKVFTLSMGTVETVKECDFFGVVSGNDVKDKFAKSGLHAVKSQTIDAPFIEEFKVAFECEMISYEDEVMVAKITNVEADESVLDEKGNIDYKKLRPITYDPVYHKYIALGEEVGNAFKDGLALK